MRRHFCRLFRVIQPRSAHHTPVAPIKSAGLYNGRDFTESLLQGRFQPSLGTSSPSLPMTSDFDTPYRAAKVLLFMQVAVLSERRRRRGTNVTIQRLFAVATRNTSRSGLEVWKVS